MFDLNVSLLALQVQTSGSVDRETLLVIFVGIIAFFFLALIAGLGVAVLYALKLKRDLLKAVDSVKATVQEKARPVVASTNDFIREMTPKIKSITDDVVAISHTVRAQVTDIDSTLSNVTAKAKAQADRVNGMVSSTLNSTSNVVASVERGVKMPIREISGVLAGLKSGWEVLTKPGEPSAKSQMRQAAEHVESMEERISRDAARAAQVNQPSSQGMKERAVERHVPVAGASRSTVDAGEEGALGGQTAVVTVGGPETTAPGAVNTLPRPRSGS